jgi:hypothetical protein
MSEGELLRCWIEGKLPAQQQHEMDNVARDVMKNSAAPQVDSLPAIAQDKAVIDRAVKICVEQVHRFQPAEAWQTQYFQQFDAYYNAATGTVQNNGWQNGDAPPLYQFNKCMAGQGFPLGSKQ